MNLVDHRIILVLFRPREGAKGFRNILDRIEGKYSNTSGRHKTRPHGRCGIKQNGLTMTEEG